jgi:LysM repeat protein
MLKYTPFFLIYCCVFIHFSHLHAQVAPTGPVTIEDKRVYLERFKPLAIKEMQRTGIPASIKLAQGLLESNAGKSQLAMFHNNHFGIKCGATWNGKTAYFKDDDIDPLTGLLKESCFRVFDTPESSYVEHSLFLQKDRYKFLFQIDPNDYRAWANGLRNAGYATDINYPAKLIKIIEDNRLDQIRLDGSERPNPSQPSENENENGNNTHNGEVVAGLDGVLYNNGVKAIAAQTGDTPAAIAKRADISLKDVLKYNELLKDGTPFKGGEMVYIQRKKRAWWGWASRKHKVMKDETMYSISQKYGVRLDVLYERNHLPEGFEPVIGEDIFLRFGRANEDVPKIRVQASKVKQPAPAPSNPAPTTMPDRPVSSTNGRPNTNDSTSPTPRRNSDDLGWDISPNKVTTDEERKRQEPNANEGFQHPTDGTTPSNTNEVYTNTPTSGSNTNNPNNDDWFAQNPSTATTTSTSTPSGNSGNGTMYPSYPPSTPSSHTTYPSSTPSYPSSGNSTSYPPSGNTTTTTYPPAKYPSTTNNNSYYTVQPGETMYAIARRHGVTPNYLKELNNLPSTDLKIGQQIRVK